MLSGSNPYSPSLSFFPFRYKMLEEPDADNPVDEQVCEQFKTDKKAFTKNATEWTKKYAK